MALYTIIRVYEVPAETRQQATDRMVEAIVLHVERDFHVKDIIREPVVMPDKEIGRSEACCRLADFLKSSWDWRKVAREKVACLPTVRKFTLADGSREVGICLTSGYNPQGTTYGLTRALGTVSCLVKLCVPGVLEKAALYDLAFEISTS